MATRKINDLPAAIRAISGSGNSGDGDTTIIPPVPGDPSSIKLQTKTVSPTIIDQVVRPDSGYDALSKVTVNAAALEEKNVTPSGSVQTITPSPSSYGLAKVTVNAVSLQEKSVAPTTSQQVITPDSEYTGLSKVTVSAAQTAGVDSTDATAAASDIRSGKTAYVLNRKITGTMQAVAAATPSISVGSTGLITATTNQNAGYVSAADKTATYQLTVQNTKTWTPGTSAQTIPSGRYLTGTQTISGDSNLKAANIKSGVSIFGVSGTYAGSGGNVGIITYKLLFPSGDYYSSSYLSYLDISTSGAPSYKTVSAYTGSGTTPITARTFAYSPLYIGLRPGVYVSDQASWWTSLSISQAANRFVIPDGVQVDFYYANGIVTSFNTTGLLEIQPSTQTNALNYIYTPARIVAYPVNPSDNGKEYTVELKLG